MADFFLILKTNSGRYLNMGEGEGSVDKGACC